MLKRGFSVLALSLILIVLVSGIGFAQDAEATPTPEPTPEVTPTPETTPTPEATPEATPTPEVTPTPDDGGEDEGIGGGEEDGDRGEKVKVCHIPSGDREKANTIEIARSAVESHLKHGDYEGECEEEFEGDADEELGGAGSKPGDFFYGVDKLFDDWFGNCLDNRQERVAELKALVKEKKFDDAEEALEGYEECAKEVEKEVSPEERGEAERSAKAIRKAIRGIEREIPDEHKKKFVRDVIDKENGIEKAAEIADKIKNLCEQLAKLDPEEYGRVCRVKGDAPKWQRDLDDDLTEEQRAAARKFGDIMSQCFRTEGRECACSELEDINKPFADRCAIVAPLAAKCEEGDEASCEAMDDATEGIEELLPDYLQDIFDDLDRDIKEDQFEFHMPRECREEGARDAGACIESMFRRNAPGPCLNALDRGEISFTNEREAREACDKIMFEENAPQECVDAGLRNPKECGQLMFKQNAPQECVDAGITGEGRDDPRKCERLMREQFGEGPEGPGGRRGPGPGPDCRRIQDPEERLKCYDNALEGIGPGGEGPAGFGGRAGRGHFPQPCEEAQALTRESCEKVMREWGEKQRSQDEGRFKQEREERDRNYRQEFENRYKEFRPPEGFHPPEGFRPPEGFKEGEFRPPEGFVPPEGFRPPEGFKEGEFRPPEGEFQQPPPTGETQPPSDSSGGTAPSGDTTSTTTTGSGGDSGGTSGTGDSGSFGGGESSGGTTGTGGVIMVDNRFVDYYYWG